MPTNILYLGYAQHSNSGSYAFNVTHETDVDFRKYLSRKAGVDPIVSRSSIPVGAWPLDISLDDVEGDVMAGISGGTLGRALYIDLLWVDEGLRGQGMGHRLVQMTEEQGRERGCTVSRALVSTPGAALYFSRLGYDITGAAQVMVKDRKSPPQRAVYWLAKDLGLMHMPSSLA